MPGTSGPIPVLYRLREEDGVLVFGPPRSFRVGIAMGYLIALVLLGSLLDSLRKSSDPLGWPNLAWHGGGIAFMAVWLVGWTRQEFARYELRLDLRSRKIVRTWTPFLGRAREETIQADAVAEVRLEQRGHWRVGLSLKDGSFVGLDAARDGDGPLRVLAESLERGLGLPLVVSEEESG